MSATTLQENIQTDSQQKTFISKKLSKVLDSRFENDKETLDTLRILSDFYTENNLRNRRNLRSLIEKRSLKINEAFLHSFSGVKEVLDKLCEDIQGMDKCCQDMIGKLAATKSQTQDLIAKTTRLQKESQKIQQRDEVVRAFLNHFQLQPEEVQILRDSRQGTLDENFFKVLDKVKKIHSNCKFLLRSNQQTAGLEIMESMALHMESAAERLYRWIQTECRQLTNESPELHPLLAQALQSLQERPVLFQYSLDECANARRAAVVRAFIDALTRGGPGGLPCPIELHAHDPLRYVGDMLAWVHQSSASEKELLEALLRLVEKDGVEGAVQQALAHITEGLCRPLKMRVEQVLAVQHSPVLLFKLIGLLKFYSNTLDQLVSGIPTSEEHKSDNSCLLVKTLQELTDLAEQLFSSALASHSGDLAERATELPPADLGPTEALKSTLTLLKDILASQTSVSPEDRKADIPKVVNALIEPLLQVCQVSAAKLVAPDMAAYLANCCHLVHSTLSLFQHTEPFLEKLQAQMDAYLDTLVSEQASHIVSSLGLGTIYNTLKSYQPARQGPLATLPGCDQLALCTAMRRLDEFLCAPDVLCLPQGNLLLSITQRQELKKRSMALVVSAYSKIYEAVSNPECGYPEVSTLLPRTPDQVQQLLN